MMVLRRHNPLIFMIHAVFFWLKADLTADQKQTFETELLALPKLDYIAQGQGRLDIAV